MSNLKERTKSRKFIAFAFIILVSTISLVLGVANFAEWSDIIKWNLGFYFTANVGGQVLHRFGGNPDPPITTDER